MLSHALRAAAGNQAPATPTDPNFNQVTLLLHGDGTNGAQNNTFIDSSPNNYSITRNGNTTQGTLTPFSQDAGYWSNNFNGSGQYFTLPNNAAFVLGTGNFTAEAWVYFTQTPSTGATFSIIFSTATSNGFNFSINNNLTVSSSLSGVLGIITTSNTVTVGAWNHIAVVRNGTNYRIYINGISTSSVTNSSNFSSASSVKIGSENTTSDLFRGDISNLRIVKGTAVYTADFTPPTTPLTAISGTSLLTCQSTSFIDKSSNNFAITRIGAPQVEPWSPFLPTSAYSTSVNGGGLRFNGTTDYLLQTSGAIGNFGTNNFTVEFWVYPLSIATSNIIDFRGTPGSSTTSLRIAFASTNPNKIVVGFSTADNQLVSTSNILTNSWTYVAVVRNGTNATIYINGVAESTITNSTNLTDAGLVIGSYRGTGFYFSGYLSSLRVVKGTAVYTSNFTPPTAPLTSITNTSLLLNGTNSGIFDNAGKNYLITVGSAQVNTSVVKYGTGSMRFGGTPDNLLVIGDVQRFGNGNFTIEAWVNPSALPGSGSNYAIVSKYNTTNNNRAWSFTLENVSTAGTLKVGLWLSTNGTALTNNFAFAYTPTVNVWFHLASVRNGNTVTTYVNGTSIGSGSFTGTVFNATAQVLLGRQDNAASYMNGYIDDLRITKGVARYTANFTPPTQAFPNQ
jgi:hypothetical protein